MANRTDEDYEIEAVSKAKIVLEIVIDGEPVALKKIVDRSQLGRDIVMRILRTFRLHGYLIQNANADWMVGPGLVRVAHDVTERKQL